tara:strand:+ start:178 stop:420 length:243 start_codon:yes stop_codon:yes gene_type:complete
MVSLGVVACRPVLGAGMGRPLPFTPLEAVCHRLIDTKNNKDCNEEQRIECRNTDCFSGRELTSTAYAVPLGKPKQNKFKL